MKRFKNKLSKLKTYLITIQKLFGSCTKYSLNKSFVLDFKSSMYGLQINCTGNIRSRYLVFGLLEHWKSLIIAEKSTEGLTELL